MSWYGSSIRKFLYPIKYVLLWGLLKKNFGAIVYRFFYCQKNTALKSSASQPKIQFILLVHISYTYVLQKCSI